MTAPSTFCGFVLAPPAARRIRRSVSETQHDLISSRRYSPRVGHGRRALSCVDAAASASPVVQAVVKPRHVGIAGAGIGGVATALALLRTPATGVEKVTLYEPRSELDAGQGAALNLTSGASVLQKAYGLELGEIARPFRSVVAKRADGSSEGAEVLMSVDVERAFQDDPAARALLWSDGECLARTVMREDLQRLLVENLPKGARIVRDSRVTDVVQDGQQWRFRLSDGSLTDDAFDLCIGADGIRSEVRRHILGRRESPIYSGIRVQFCIAQPKDAELETDSLVQWFGDGSYCLQYAAGVGPTARELLAHSFQSRVPADENVRYDQSNIKADCKRRLEAAGMPQLGVIDLIDRCDRFIDVGVYYHKPADTWTDALGGTVLIGDAAHAMPPFLAQGANQAIQDAHALASALAGVGEKFESVLDALQGYERSRQPFTESMMQSSRVLGLLETQAGPGAIVRNNALRFAGLSGIASRAFLKASLPTVL